MQNGAAVPELASIVYNVTKRKETAIGYDHSSHFRFQFTGRNPEAQQRLDFGSFYNHE